MRLRLTRKLFVILAACLLICVVGLCAFANIQHDKPVLAHWLAETNCTCGDFHEEVSGIVILNPFRDRAPEIAADGFFSELRNGRCNDAAGAGGLCSYALDNHRVAHWKLVNRADNTRETTLYYKLTKIGAENNPRGQLTGEGAVTLSRDGDTWSINWYSSYF